MDSRTGDYPDSRLKSINLIKTHWHKNKFTFKSIIVAIVHKCISYSLYLNVIAEIPCAYIKRSLKDSVVEGHSSWSNG